MQNPGGIAGGSHPLTGLFSNHPSGMNAKSWRDCGGGRTPSHLYVLKTLDIDRTFFQSGADLNDYLMRASIPDLLHRSNYAALHRSAIPPRPYAISLHY